MKDPLYWQKWGALFWNLKMRDKYDLAFYFIFMQRRVVYVIIAFTLVHYNQFQIILLNFLNLFTAIYQGSNMPLSRRYQNWLELWNEFWIQMATYNLILFTDFVLTHENKYMYGWSFIVIMMMQIVVHFIGLLYFIMNALSLFFIKFCYKSLYLKKFLPWF